MGLRDEMNIVTSNVVPTSVTLLSQEKYAVGSDGVKTAAIGDFVYGIVRIGRPINEASQVITSGECTAYVDGSGTALAVDDYIAGDVDGKMVKAIPGSTIARGAVLEAVITDTTARIFLF